MVSQQISAATSPALEHPIRSRPKIPLMRPIVDEEMIQAAVDALRNERLVMGESVFKFEEEFARYCGTRHAISTASGTAALQIGLQALGIGPGDLVITTPFTFIASSNAVLHAGARPEFADVEKTGFNLDPVEVGRKISKETRAIVPVHLYGQPARMKEFRDLASEHGTRLVEDACQAHGSEISGKRAGSMGDVGCFSFYTSKNMTVAGDGGMIVTDDDTVAETAKSLRDCGRASKYTMSRIGYTSRLNTVNAAIGRVQLRKLDRWNLVRRRLASRYRKGLQDVGGITLPPEDNPGATSVYHLFVIRSKNRDELAKKLEANGIESMVHYPVPSHLQTPYRRLYGYTEGMFPVSERLAGEVLSLPLYPEMPDEDVDRVCQVLRDNSTGQA
ncbi:DegT/DnrJ/EryC1/StrS family aminotransferase [Candidatus Bathyarchaeota archaeon]|nr:MAG: DegT/DnrJ/EryC1/StrS family aminotransferase [Candidatus Bathyarchaeota archaeon]